MLALHNWPAAQRGAIDAQAGTVYGASTKLTPCLFEPVAARSTKKKHSHAIEQATGEPGPAHLEEMAVTDGVEGRRMTQG